MKIKKSLIPKREKPPGESPENASSGRLGTCLVFRFQLCCRLSGRPLRRTVSPLPGRTFRSCRERLFIRDLPASPPGSPASPAADRLILLSSIRSLRCRPGIPAPRLRPDSRPHRLCPASPESGPPIPVPSSVVFPYPAYEFPPSAAMPMHGSHVYYTLYLEFLFQV